MTSLAICTIFKDEGRYLLEWIAWHRAMGADHIYLYDNGSTDGGADHVRMSDMAGHVTLIDWPERPGQLPAYRHFIKHHAANWDWAAFIDADEFLVPHRDGAIKPVIERLSMFSAILVQWRVFGPSGWVERPDGLVLDNYTLRVPDDAAMNRHIKSIVKCVDLLDVRDNPHEFRVKGPACNTAGRLVPNIAIQPAECHANLVINHYQTRSRADWAEKIARGNAMFNLTGPAYPPELIDHYAGMATERDTSVQALMPPVRALLAAQVSFHAASQPESENDPAGNDPGGWFQESPLVWLHPAGWAMICQEQSRPDRPWVAALRGPAAGLIDPSYLVDDLGRIFEFESAAAAMDACDAELEAMEEA